MSRKELNIHITTGTIIKTILVGLFFYLAFYFKNLLLLVLTAVVIASAVEPAVARMEKYKIPRSFGTLIIYIGLLALVILGVTLVVPVFVVETTALAQAIPAYLSSFNAWLNATLEGSGFSTNITSVEPTSENLQGAAQGISGLASFFFSGARGALTFVFSSLFSFLLVFVLAFYFTVQKYGIDNFLKIVVPPTHSAYAINLWRRSQRKIGAWMQGQLVLALIIGGITYVGLLVLGVKYAFLLALFAMAGSLIPMIGPFISMVPAVAIALSDGTSFSESSVISAALVIGLYILIQLFESNFIYPLVVKNIVGVPALVVILGVIIGGSLFGFLGMVLSVPVAAAAMEYVRDIEKRNHNQEKLLKQAAKELETKRA